MHVPQMELQRMGGPTNVTILPHGAMHHHFGSHSADRHAHRQRHEILGEFEDMGGCARLARQCPLHTLAAAHPRTPAPSQVREHHARGRAAAWKGVAPRAGCQDQRRAAGKVEAGRTPSPRPSATHSEDCATATLMLPSSHPQGEEMLRQRVPAPASLPARA